MRHLPPRHVVILSSAWLSTQAAREARERNARLANRIRRDDSVGTPVGTAAGGTPAEAGRAAGGGATREAQEHDARQANRIRWDDSADAGMPVGTAAGGTPAEAGGGDTLGGGGAPRRRGPGRVRGGSAAATPAAATPAAATPAAATPAGAAEARGASGPRHAMALARMSLQVEQRT